MAMATRQGDLETPRQPVAAWAALLRAGAPSEVWIPRRCWDNAVRVVAQVDSAMALRDRTKTAKDYGLLEVQPGQRGKEGNVLLREPGASGQFVPFEISLRDLARAGGQPKPA